MNPTPTQPQPPYKADQLLALPDGSIGRFLRVEDWDSQPADPGSGTRGYEWMLLAVKSHGRTVYIDLSAVTPVDEYPSAEEV